MNQSSINKGGAGVKFVVWFGIAALVLGSVGAIIGTSGRGGNGGDNETASLLEAFSKNKDRFSGAEDASVVLVEYGDYQCPACSAYQPFLKKLMEDFGEQILFVYRHFPLKNIHVNAELSARSAEAAGAQGKFWEMHDMIYANQNRWATAEDAKGIFEDYATALGLDLEKFRVDRDAKETGDRIDASFDAGVASGVEGTPTFFVNGVKIQNPLSYDEFKALITEALEVSASNKAGEDGEVPVSDVEPN